MTIPRTRTTRRVSPRKEACQKACSSSGAFTTSTAGSDAGHSSVKVASVQLRAVPVSAPGMRTFSEAGNTAADLVARGGESAVYPPAWQSARYRVLLSREGGQWRIKSLTLLETVDT